MRIAILTNEYPPNIYGGAGVHVEYLTRELTRVEDGQPLASRSSASATSRVRDGNLTVRGVQPAFDAAVRRTRGTRSSSTRCSANLVMAGLLEDVDVVHCHTWYTHLAGCLVKQLTGARLVLTTHSLEPHRPWKVEQLGTAYHASSWVERTAYENADGVIAVSESMRDDVHDALRRPPREDPRHPQRDRPEPVPADARPRRAGAVRDRPRHAVRAVRRPDHPAEGDHPPGQGDQVRSARASRSSSAPGPPTRRRSAAR